MKKPTRHPFTGLSGRAVSWPAPKPTRDQYVDRHAYSQAANAWRLVDQGYSNLDALPTVPGPYPAMPTDQDADLEGFRVLLEQWTGYHSRILMSAGGRAVRGWDPFVAGGGDDMSAILGLWSGGGGKSDPAPSPSLDGAPKATGPSLVPVLLAAAGALFFF